MKLPQANKAEIKAAVHTARWVVKLVHDNPGRDGHIDRTTLAGRVRYRASKRESILQLLMDRIGHTEESRSFKAEIESMQPFLDKIADQATLLLLRYREIFNKNFTGDSHQGFDECRYVEYIGTDGRGLFFEGRQARKEGSRLRTMRLPISYLYRPWEAEAEQSFRYVHINQALAGAVERMDREREDRDKLVYLSAKYEKQS